MNNDYTYQTDQIRHVRRHGILLHGLTMLVCVLLASAASGGQVPTAVAPCGGRSGRDSRVATLTPPLPFATPRGSPSLFSFFPSRYEQTNENTPGYTCFGVAFIALYEQKWRPT